MASGMVRDRIGRLALCACAFALAGCNPGGNGEPLALSSPTPAASAPAAAPGTPAAFASPAGPVVARPVAQGGVYRVSTGDVLEVAVYQVPDLSRTVEVDGSGRIVLPLIKEVPASGRTVRELETDIARRLTARYLQKAEVTVYVKDAVGQRVTVDGAVKQPGVLQARGEMTLLRAIAEAKGFSDTADPGNVLVFRMTEQGRTAARYDVSAIRSGQAADPPVYGGDTIVVDESTTKTVWKQFREALPVAGLFRVF